MCSLGPPPTGQSQVSNEAVRYLRDQGHVVDVIDKKILGFGWAKLGHYCASVLQMLWYLLLGPRPQLAYLTASRSPGGFLRDAVFILLCRLRGVPAINHVHGSDLPRLLRHRWMGRIARRLLNLLSGNIVLSRAMASAAGQAGLRNAVVIRNFAAPEFFAATSPRRGPEAPLRILYFSNVMRAKGVFDLIEACCLLERTRPDVELHIAGQILEETRALGAQTRRALIALTARHPFVRWHGPLYGADKVRAYAEADIFCLPSYYDAEAAPLSLLDAMAAGVACVVTDVGGVREIVADGAAARVVPPREPDALAAHLLELAQSPGLRQQLGARAREQALAHFTLDRFRRELGAAVDAAVGVRQP